MAKRGGKGGAVPADLKTWAKAQTKRGGTASWQAWPEVARAEIVTVLDLCDAGEAKVSQPAMLTRLRDAHGVVATRAMLDAFIASLGRQGWTKP